MQYSFKASTINSRAPTSIYGGHRGYVLLSIYTPNTIYMRFPFDQLGGFCVRASNGGRHEGPFFIFGGGAELRCPYLVLYKDPEFRIWRTYGSFFNPLYQLAAPTPRTACASPEPAAFLRPLPSCAPIGKGTQTHQLRIYTTYEI